MVSWPPLCKTIFPGRVGTRSDLQLSFRRAGEPASLLHRFSDAGSQPGSAFRLHFVYRVFMYEREVAMVGDPVMAIRGIAYFVSQAVPT